MLTGCTPAPQLHLHATHFDAMPGWESDDHAQALKVLRRSCAAIQEQPGEAWIGNGKLQARATAWQEICDMAESITPAQAREFFEAHFTPFTAGGDGLFTGYYEPVLHGARKRHGHYQTPVYHLPWDVQAGIPYYSRAEIDRGALKHRKLELLWVNDPVMLFFAQVQGSARVKLADGGTVRIGYAGKNNQPYVAIGKILKESGELEEINFFTLRQWLYAHPAQAKKIMERNPSYVFFRELPKKDGPLGAEGVPLVPERSLAVDARLIPYGMPLFVQTALPDGGAFHQLMIAQDTGGAIKGPVRGDIFFGAGTQAEALAGMMKSRGTYVLLVPNSIATGL